MGIAALRRHYDQRVLAPDGPRRPARISIEEHNAIVTELHRQHADAITGARARIAELEAALKAAVGKGVRTAGR